MHLWSFFTFQLAEKKSTRLFKSGNNVGAYWTFLVDICSWVIWQEETSMGQAQELPGILIRAEPSHQACAFVHLRPACLSFGEHLGTRAQSVEDVLADYTENICLKTTLHNNCPKNFQRDFHMISQIFCPVIKLQVRKREKRLEGLAILYGLKEIKETWP